MSDGKAAVAMETCRLGTSELLITPLGFGAWAIGGGGWQFGWGPQDDAASIAAIRRALDQGINWIDTAAVYGLGHSEEVVAQALAGRGERPYVFTKCGMVWDDTGNVRRDLSPDSIRRELDASLRRLKTDVIDLYQIHWPPEDPSRIAEIDGAIAAMAEGQRQGKIRYIGVSNFNVAQMERARKVATITSDQPPYSLLHREAEQDILPYCRAHDIGVIAYSPMASGLLTGAMTRERINQLPSDDWRRRSPDYREPRLSRNLALVETLRAIGARHGRSPGEVAIAWVLRTLPKAGSPRNQRPAGPSLAATPAVTGAIVGARSAEQVDGWIGAATFRPSDDEAAELERL